jgi:hypothetical protein
VEVTKDGGIHRKAHCRPVFRLAERRHPFVDEPSSDAMKVESKDGDDL